MSLKDFNPGWLSFGAILASGMLSSGISLALNSRDAQENREFREHQRAWNASMESRFADQRNLTDKTLVGLQKDVEAANKTLASIQQSLMVRPTPASLTSQHIP